MRGDQRGSAAGDLFQVAGAEPSHPGRIDVRERALRKVAEETSANTIGVERGAVSVSVTEYSGGLALRISTPLPVPSLDDTAAIQAGKPVLERVSDIQEQLRERVGRITGREVTRVNVTITGATVPTTRRVR